MNNCSDKTFCTHFEKISALDRFTQHIACYMNNKKPYTNILPSGHTERMLF